MLKAVIPTTLALIVAGLFPAEAAGQQATFIECHLTPDGSPFKPTALARDGRNVVGEASAPNAGKVPYIWAPSNGALLHRRGPNGHSVRGANCVNATGFVVAGYYWMGVNDEEKDSRPTVWRGNQE